MYDVMIIGGGIAGLSAALYSGRFQLKTLVIGERIGGTIILADNVSNYPGFKKITGANLFEKIKEHALDYGLKIAETNVKKIKRYKDYFEVFNSDKSYKTKTIIFATGTERKQLNVKGEKEFANRGVHYCALCDGVFYKNKIIAVAGGSDSAAKEALLLTRYAKKVYIIYRKRMIRAEPINLKKVAENKKIEIINNTNITEIKGGKFVNKIIIDRQYKGLKEIKLDALFIEIGSTPVSDLAKSIGVKTNKQGEIIINRDSKTNVEGVFACGDVVDSKFKQAITGAAEGVIAAYNVYRYVNMGMQKR